MTAEEANVDDVNNTGLPNSPMLSELRFVCCLDWALQWPIVPF